MCTRPQCHAQNAAEHHLQYILTVSLVLQRRDYRVELHLLDAQGVVVSQTEAECEICGLDEVTELIETGAARLTAALQRSTRGPVLSVRSVPSDAQVRVDGEVVGRTPIDIPLALGVHKVRVAQPGRVSVEREFDLAPGVRAQVRFDLDAQPVGQAPPAAVHVASRYRPLGFAAVGVGLVLLGGGATMLAFDGTPNRRRCGPADVDAQGDCHYIFHFKWGAAAAVASGAALLASGVLVLILSKRTKAQTKARIEPLGLGLRGRF